MPQDLDAFARWLKARQPHLEVRDEALVERFWRVHPRFQFLKSLPWGWNVLDIGAGSGGLVHWKGWLKPDRADLNLYGVDRNEGEFREFYTGWETINLDREMPSFAGVDFNGVIASHLIEYLDAPERLITWLGERAKPGARAYLEWTGPSSLDLPSRDQLSQHGIEVLTSNFTDDREHKEAPDLASVERWLGEVGFSVIASGAIDLGILGEELFARAADRDTRSMGYWSLTRSSLYTVAIKSDDATSVARERRATMGATPVIAQRTPMPPFTPTDKQALVRELGVEEAFERYKQMSGLPESDRIERRPVANLYDFAKQHGAVFHEIDPRDQLSAAPPLRVVGEGGQDVAEDPDRGLAVTCLIEARVRPCSGFIEIGGTALLHQGHHGPIRTGSELASDPIVFHSEADGVWVISSDDPTDIAQLEEGFTLLGPPDSDSEDASDRVFRYVAACASGALPPVPLLVDRNMPAAQREALWLVLPRGMVMIELLAITQVRRLWCVTGQVHAQRITQTPAGAGGSCPTA